MSTSHLTRSLRALRGWLSRERRRRLSEAGYAAVMVAIVVPTVGIGCAAVAVDTGAWYVEVAQVQKAVDAAALAGVPYLPQDFANAKARALEVAARNGYDNTGDHSVTVTVGDKPTQLRVSISSTIRNTFGTVIGVPKQTITRAGTADYQGPAPMGSPCNTFGNEPSPGMGPASAQGSSPLPNCKRTPQFWALVEGPETGKVQGDRYQTLNCENSGVDGCSSSKKNEEYDEFGYVFVVKVEPGAVGTPVDVQLYDPMMVSTDRDCGLLPKASKFPNNTLPTNPYVLNSDARNRYSKDGTTYADFCTGDMYPGAGSGDKDKHPLTTSFVLRQQSDTQNAQQVPGAARRRRQPVHQAVRHVQREEHRTSTRRSSSSVTRTTSPRLPRRSTTGARCAPSSRTAPGTSTSRCGPTSRWAARAPATSAPATPRLLRRPATRRPVRAATPSRSGR